MYYTSVFLQSTNSILEECRKNLSFSKRTIRISDVRNEIGWKRRRRRKNVVVTREIILFGLGKNYSKVLLSIEGKCYNLKNII